MSGAALPQPPPAPRRASIWARRLAAISSGRVLGSPGETSGLLRSLRAAIGCEVAAGHRSDDTVEIPEVVLDDLEDLRGVDVVVEVDRSVAEANHPEEALAMLARQNAVVDEELDGLGIRGRDAEPLAGDDMVADIYDGFDRRLQVADAGGARDVVGEERLPSSAGDVAEPAEP